MLDNKGFNLWAGFFGKNGSAGTGKMPKATLLKGDFSKGLVEPLCQRKYDAIIATYSLHHLTDVQKVTFLKRFGDKPK